MILRNVIRGYRYIGILIAVIIVASSCTKLEGHFAFKGLHDDTYRKIEGAPEFSSDEEIRWVYAFGKVRDSREIGVMYLKKELVWVEVRSEIVTINKENRMVRGTIKAFLPGEYRIVVTDVRNDNKEIEGKDFFIFAREEEE